MAIEPDDVGRWIGNKFVFFEPFTVVPGLPPAETVEVNPDELGPEVSRDDAIYVFLNGIIDPFGVGPDDEN